MRISGLISDDMVLKELSKRFKQYRISYPMTQAELEEKSMVSLSTIKRFENGEDISLSKMIRLLAALDLQEHLEMLIPDQSVRPSAYLDNSVPRRRARKENPKRQEWKWGDEE